MVRPPAVFPVFLQFRGLIQFCDDSLNKADRALVAMPINGALD